MALKKKKTENAPIGFDMTPMIDCVFQLLIFFIVCTQITQQENVSLRLPDAISGVEDTRETPKLFTVHIAPANQGVYKDMPDGYGWFCYGHPTPKTPDEMKSILNQEARRVDASRKLDGWSEENNRSENLIAVRCDARCPAGEFAKLIELMVEVRMYKIKVYVLRDMSQ
jgi:biopolymer transport protein ExbD